MPDELIILIDGLVSDDLNKIINSFIKSCVIKVSLLRNDKNKGLTWYHFK